MASYELTVKQGKRFEQWFRWERSEGVGRPIAGLNARLQFRQRAGGELYLELRDGTDPHRVELEPFDPDYPDGGGDPVGWFRVIIGATQTALMARGGVWELELYNPNDADEVYAPADGTFKVVKQITVGEEELAPSG